MNWKPIPKEEPANEGPKNKTHIRAKFIGNSNAKGEVHPSISYRLLQKVSGRLLEFVKREKKFNRKELSELILDLQNTVSKLQKKKNHLIQKEANKLNPLFKSKKQKHRKNNRN
ncbi:hypothetical protein ACFLZH_04000 [Patescibacteria group bacterium]